LLEAFGLEGAERWRELAAALAESFRQRFWVEDSDGPYPAIALDRDGDPVGSLSSNIGHLLGTGILDGEENDAVARRLNSADLNCGFGLRTLAASSGGFNPVSYHRGSVWAHDTAIAVAGLSRTSGTEAQRAAVSLVEGLLGAAEAFDYRLPELYAGHDRAARRRPLPYPAACHPQAWAAASSIVVLTALLGIQADVPGGRVILAPLATPTGLKRVDGLCVGGEPVSIEIGANGEAKMTGGPLGMKVVAST
jgi:glycogen debranching enzyme